MAPCASCAVVVPGSTLLAPFEMDSSVGALVAWNFGGLPPLTLLIPMPPPLPLVVLMFPGARAAAPEPTNPMTVAKFDGKEEPATGTVTAAPPPLNVTVLAVVFKVTVVL